MIVTPKEIDELIDNMKEIVAKRDKLCTIIKSILKEKKFYDFFSFLFGKYSIISIIEQLK